MMRKIAFATGSRATASPLGPVIRELQDKCELYEIKTEGLFGHEEAFRVGIEYFKPDIMLLLGDRYETLVAASVAAQMCLPIAHLSGGDRTEGANDDSFRHAITKLAYWHFPICEWHANRIIQMGEDPARVFAIGAPGVDQLAGPRLTKAEMQENLGISLEKPITLVAYHPETLSKMSIRDQYIRLMNEYPIDGTLIISGANADAGGAELNEYLKNDVEGIPNTVYRENFGEKLWISLMHECDVIIGNSSCAIIEGMTLGKKIINIGDRQKGRFDEALAMFSPPIMIDAHFNLAKVNEIRPGAVVWVEDLDSVTVLPRPQPFGIPGTVSPAIAEKLLSVELPETPRKPFYVQADH